MGHDASYAGFTKRACPFADTPGQALERAQWLKGWEAGERDALPATE